MAVGRFWAFLRKLENIAPDARSPAARDPVVARGEGQDLPVLPLARRRARHPPRLPRPDTDAPRPTARCARPLLGSRLARTAWSLGVGEGLSEAWVCRQVLVGTLLRHAGLPHPNVNVATTQLLFEIPKHVVTKTTYHRTQNTVFPHFFYRQRDPY